MATLSSIVASSIESQTPGVDVIIQVRVGPKRPEKEDHEHSLSPRQEKVESSGGITHSTPKRPQKLKLEFDAGTCSPPDLHSNAELVKIKDTSDLKRQPKSSNPHTETCEEGGLNVIDLKNSSDTSEVKLEDFTVDLQDRSEKENKGIHSRIKKFVQSV